MKILQVSPIYYPIYSGVPEHVKNISERLAKVHDVTVYTTDSSGLLKREETINGVKIKRFNCWEPNSSYFLSFELERYLNRHSDEFDLIHAHGYHSLPALHAARAKGDNRLIFTTHYHGGGHTFARSLLHLAYKAIAKRILERSEKVIAVSNYERNLLVQNFGIEDKIQLIPNGLNLVEFSGTLPKDRGTQKILYVGRLEKYKGIQYAIEALPGIDNRVILEIVGDGPYKKALENQVHKLTLNHRVRFYPKLSREALLQKYGEANVLVLLSCFEAYSMVVAEALASGTRCLVANKQALSEWIDNENCFGVDFPVNIDFLSKQISSIVSLKKSQILKTKKKILDWDEVVAMLQSQVYLCK